MGDMADWVNDDYPAFLDPFERSEDPRAADNGPSRMDWLDMGHCPDCRAPEGKCLCDTEDTEALLRAERDERSRHGA